MLSGDQVDFQLAGFFRPNQRFNNDGCGVAAGAVATVGVTVAFGETGSCSETVGCLLVTNASLGTTAPRRTWLSPEPTTWALAFGGLALLGLRPHRPRA